MSHMPGGQKTSCRNWVSLPTMWALGIKLMGSGLVADVFAPHVSTPAVVVTVTYTVVVWF